ncbi:MAG: ParA family protein [Chloroflexi bacterium]|nr:MAG: ParA family protein [Chloroflexota bacterium]TME17172.1 MAG: ParA family protein [Chloroflexota bacterium]TME17200.1 MAG: ParA family protein [Chloroflexota bacterium]
MALEQITPTVAPLDSRDPKILGYASETRIMAVVNQKGGVGKTTTAINLAASMAELGRQVVLIDLDPQANSTSGLGFDVRRQRLNVYHLLAGEAVIDDVAVATSVPGLHLVPSHVSLAGGEIELALVEDRERRLQLALRELSGGFGHVLIDCPPSLGLLTLNALTAAHEVLIPVQCEYYALEGLGHLLYTMELVRERLNPGLRLAGILMTQLDSRTTLGWDVVQEVRRAYPEKIYETLIPRNVRLSEAPSHGQPVTEYDPNCRGAQAYRQLAKEVLSR